MTPILPLGQIAQTALPSCGGAPEQQADREDGQRRPSNVRSGAATEQQARQTKRVPQDQAPPESPLSKATKPPRADPPGCVVPSSVDVEHAHETVQRIRSSTPNR